MSGGAARRSFLRAVWVVGVVGVAGVELLWLRESCRMQVVQVCEVGGGADD